MKFPEPKQLAKNLQADVLELCQPSGRMVGSPGHTDAEQLLLRRLSEVGCQPYANDSYELPYVAEGFDEAGELCDHQFLNLVGVVPGTDRDLPPILVGAHYDSVIAAPCADDNGAAVAITLAIAEAAATSGGLARDLIVAIFDAEEPPYFCTPSMGSIRFYEDQLDQRGVQFALIFDLVGHDVTFPAEYLPILSEMLGPIGSQAAQAMIKNFLFVMGSESHIELPRIAARASESNSITMLATLNEYVGDMSDHGVFRQNRIPYLFLSCGRWEHYHRPTDTPEKLNYDKMALISQLAATILEDTSKITLSGTSVGDHSLEFEIQTLKQALGLALPMIQQHLGMETLETRSDIKKIVDAVTTLGL